MEALFHACLEVVALRGDEGTIFGAIPDFSCRATP
jgi:hypothetical protein